MSVEKGVESEVVDLDWTGERYLPEIEGDVALEHLHRYAMAKELAYGKIVLDLASGEGYGSSILAEAADHVFGVDVSREAVEHANQQYGRKNLEFLIGTCAEVPLADNSVDVVVSFETIEHHAQHEEMMREIKRVLRPGGVVVISSPDKYEYSIVPDYSNPYHVKELFGYQFARLMADHFAHVTMYGQRVIYGSAILLEKAYGPVSFYTRKGFESGPMAGIHKPVYLIAVASDGALPELAGGIFEEPVQDSEIAKKITERDDRIGGLIRQLAERDAQVDDLRQTIAERDERIGGFIRAVAERDAQVDDLRQANAKRDERIGGFVRAMAERDAQVDDLRQANAERDERIGGFVRAMAERDAQVDDLRQANAERDERIGGFIRAMAERDAQVDDLRRANAERDERIGGFIRAMAERDMRLGELECAVAERDRLNDVANDLRKQVLGQQEQIAMIYRSSSWRLSAPIRVLGGLLRPQQHGRNVAASSAARVDVARQDASITTDSDPKEDAPDALLPTKEEPALDHPCPDPQTKAILLVSYYCPTRAHAGGLRILDIYSFIKDRYPQIRLELYTHKRPEIDGAYDDLPEIFDAIHYAPSEQLTLEWLQAELGCKPSYEVVDFQFHQAAYGMEAFRAVAGKILFTPMESLLRSLFLDMKAGVVGLQPSFLMRCRANLKCAIEELGFAKAADETICVSKSDAAFLRAITGNKKIRYLETGISTLEFPILKQGAGQLLDVAQKGNIIIFVAYFGSDTNVAALKWFLDNVHPVIKASVPDYVLEVVGRGDLTHFDAYAVDAAIHFIGAVPSISPYINQAKVGIAPALGGSGFRGKINQYSIFGVPSVVSPISANGLVYQDEYDIFVAESPDMFARRCIELMVDNDLNSTMGERARATCLQKYTWDSRADAIEKYYNLESMA